MRNVIDDARRKQVMRVDNAACVAPLSTQFVPTWDTLYLPRRVPDRCASHRTSAVVDLFLHLEWEAAYEPVVHHVEDADPGGRHIGAPKDFGDLAYLERTEPGPSPALRD